MKKNSEKKISFKKVYHIYLKNHCVSHSLNQEEFKRNWQLLNNLVGILTTNYSIDDLSYEEVEYNPESSEGSY
jgi:hypothetical protein